MCGYTGYMSLTNRIPVSYVKSINISRISTFIKANLRWGDITWDDGTEVSYLSQSLSNGDRYVSFVYDIYKEPNDTWRRLDYQVHLLTSQCNYGGVRYWFQCPSCDSRVGILYLRGSILLCRRCSVLTYESNLLSGKHKKEGRIISAVELDVLKGKIKRRYYAGKPTKIFIRYMRKVKRYLATLSRLGYYLSKSELAALI